MIYDVVVVGAGFSAIAMACNLIDALPMSSSVAIVGDNTGFGRGTAYRTELHLHRLNVPTGRMSLFPERPDDFVEWLESKGKRLSGSDFASRGDYGLYLRDTLAKYLRRRRCRIDFIRAKATGCLELYGGSFGFQLENGDEIAGRHVVLCLGLGNAPLPVSLEALSPAARARIVNNPWRLSWLRRVRPQERICILGSGLTMVDQVLSLRAHGHRGPIEVLSRRGLAPLPHLGHPPPPAALDIDALPRRLSALLHELRRAAEQAENWRCVMDALRPQTQALWQTLPPTERARFLRHALPWWNIHRHRIAPQVYERFQALRDDGTIHFHAGFVKAIDETDRGPILRYRPRGTTALAALPIDRLVNCTGMERAGIQHSPLLKEMASRGLIRPAPLGLGIDVDPASRIIDAQGDVQDRVYAIGALTAGRFWEITAVPDIRVQAQSVARAIATANTP